MNVNEHNDVLTANRPYLKKIILYKKYVYIINIELTILIMSTLSK